MRRLFTRATLIAALLGAAALTLPVPGTGSAYAAKKKKKPKKAKKARKAIAPKAFSAQSVVRMHRSGMTADEIVAKATDAGFTPTARDRAAMKRGRVPKSLIAALSPESAEPAVEAPKSEPINISRLTDPNEIDFDSVPPPSGMPTKYRDKPAPQPKKLDTSTRPSAPFDEKEQAAAAAKKPAPAAQPAPVASASATNSGGKRVVFTPGQ